MRQILSGTKSFINFVAIWNHTQGLHTPAVHKNIVHFLQSAWINGDTKALLMAFRGCGKSTLVGLFCSWILYRNPNVRILVVSAESDLAKRMVRTVKRLIERHPYTAPLKPKRAEQWAGNCFTINRPQELRDASMTAEGILGNITGMRADVVICDDVEVPNTANTAAKREKLRCLLGEVDYILVPNGLQLYVGTPHTEHSIYSTAHMGDTPPFLYGFNRLEIPLLDKGGKSVWAERFSDTDIHILRTRHGEQKFNAQMLLKCVNIHAGRLNTHHIQTYDTDIEVRYINRIPEVYITNKKMVSACCVWDPAYGLNGGDDSIIAVVFMSKDGVYFVHDIRALQHMGKNCETDPAHAQCYGVLDVIKTYPLTRIYIESNGVGKFLPALLSTIIKKHNIGCAIQDFHSKTPKNIRIMESLQAVLDAGYLWVRTSVINQGFLSQMQDFNPLEKGNKDDMLDAVARCITLEPTRIQNQKKSYTTPIKNAWQGNPPVTLKNDFPVL